jgi:virginiamycin B lyase
VVHAAVGPDGAIWYTDGRAPRIGRVAPDGTVRTYPVPGFAPPDFISSGPDGALWFTRSRAIARMSVTGQYTEYALDAEHEARGIVAGPDGALWFTEQAGNRIGRITPAGRVTEYPLPSGQVVQCGQLCPGDITVGPDGALWFVNMQLAGVPGIGRVATNGRMTFYSLPARSVPDSITTGPDGNLWFVEYRGPGLGRVTPEGAVTEFTVPGLPASGAVLAAIAPGPDGAVWFTIGPGLGDLSPAATTRPGQLGRIAPDGSVTLYTPPGEGVSGPIVRAPDGSLWAFGESTVTRIAVG